MDKVDFYYFSGTGNTMKLVKKMSEVFLHADVQCELYPISAKTSPAINLDNTIGIAFPIAGFRTYPVVWDFITRLPETTVNTPVFLMASFAGNDGSISAQVDSALRSKGYNLLGYAGVIMPSNFMLKKIDAEVDKTLVAKGEAIVAEFAKNLLAGKTKWKPSRKLLAIFSSFVYNLFFVTGLFQKMFKLKVDADKCTGCGCCVGLCPVGNIEMLNGIAVLKNNCQDCMRCFAFCPANAIKLYSSKPYSACSYIDFENELNG